VGGSWELLQINTRGFGCFAISSYRKNNQNIPSLYPKVPFSQLLLQKRHFFGGLFGYYYFESSPV
jgi:hypothetical protein